MAEFDKLTQDEVAKIFDKLSEIRGAGDVSLSDKASVTKDRFNNWRDDVHRRGEPGYTRNESTELDRIRELSGLPPLSEGPKWDAIKKGAKNMYQSGKQVVHGKESLSANKLQRLWAEESKPVDRKGFNSFLQKIGVTDKEIEQAMSVVPGFGVKLDPKVKAHLNKIANIATQLNLNKDLKNHIAINGAETNESVISEEIDNPALTLHDKTVLQIFQELEKKLPELKIKPTGETDAKTGKPKARVVNTEESIMIINKLVEQHLLGRKRR